MKKIDVFFFFCGRPQRQMLTSKDVGSTDNNLPSLPRSCGEKTIIQVYGKKHLEWIWHFLLILHKYFNEPENDFARKG